MAKAVSQKKREGAVMRYLKEVRAEMSKVTWPTREEAIRLTLIVLAVTILMAFFLGGVDWVFDQLFRLIIS